MTLITRKPLFRWFFPLLLLIAAALAIAGIFIGSGIYNIGADDAHTRPVHQMLQTLRERSIETRASKLEVPANLMDPARIVQGAGNYDAMCVACHLSPGVSQTELSRGLYPAPPNLTTTRVDAASAFWVIKHGIKASGMAAWGLSMDDEYIWNMTAFLQTLPDLDAAKYHALVGSSGGHSHGGGESMGHDHAAGADDDHATHEHVDGHSHGNGATDSGHADEYDHQGEHNDEDAAADHANGGHDSEHVHHDAEAGTPTLKPATPELKAGAAPSADSTTPDDHANHDHQH